MASMNLQPGFVALVEAHEREWGTEAYPGRPTLSQLLHSRIVCLWTLREDARSRSTTPVRMFMTCYNDLASFQNALTELVMASKVTSMPNRRLVKVFVDQNEFEVVAIRAELKPKGQVRP